MKPQLRSLLLTATVLLGTAAFAQPLPPYNVTVTGTVAGCTPGGYVNILTVQNTQPGLDIDVPLDANCGYAVNLSMDSPLGWFQVSSQCGGAIQTGIGSYTVNTFDSLYVVVNLNCGGANADCLGVPGGSALPGTLCDDNDPNTQYDAWTADCQCTGVPIQPCQACFDVTQALSGNGDIPFTALLSNCSSGGVAPYAYEWSFDGGLTFEPAPADTAFVFTEGNHTICLLMTSADGCTSMTCDTLVVDADGTINPGTGNAPCEAGFFVMQAYQWVDSAGSGNGGGGEPVPNELWVWNLSNGGTGNFQFVWDFEMAPPPPNHTRRTSTIATARTCCASRSSTTLAVPIHSATAFPWMAMA
ncbi:MAG: hypothetical protein R2818_14655 [Flavobacteriales bacterium]